MPEKQVILGIGPGETSRTCVKQMIISFFGRTDYICCIIRENKKTVTRNSYTTICLPAMWLKVHCAHQDKCSSTFFKVSNEVFILLR